MALFTAKDVHSVTWLDDTTIAYGLSNDIVVYDVVAGAVVRCIELVGPVTSITVNHPTTTVSALGRLSIGSWRLPGGEQLKMTDRARLPPHNCVIHFDDDDECTPLTARANLLPINCITINDSSIAMFGGEFKTLDGRYIIRVTDARGDVSEFYVRDSPVQTLEFNTDWTRMAVITTAHQLTVFDMALGTLCLVTPHNGI